MEVGPSAAPMMPMEAASLRLEARASRATIIVPKMPNCAAAPSSTSLGFSSSGPKSVMAPTPMKMSSGKSSFLMPASYSTRSSPSVAGHAGGGDVGEDGAEADGQQQHGLELFDDGQVDQHAADGDHHQLQRVVDEALAGLSASGVAFPVSPSPAPNR